MKTLVQMRRITLLSIAAAVVVFACLMLVPAFGHADTAHAATKPAKASITKVSSTAAGKATVKVKKSKGAKGYQVKASQSKKYKGKTTKTVKSKSPTVTVGKLEQDKTYYFTARTYAKGRNGKVTYGAWSDPKSARVSNGVGQAEIADITQPEPGTIKVRAKKTKGATAYQVQASLSSSFSKALTRTEEAKGATATVDGLIEGATYSVRMRGYKMLGGKRSYGAWGTPSRVLIDEEPVDSDDDDVVEFGGSGSGTRPANTEQSKALVKKVQSYDYKINPVNGKLNNIVFVETKNPDPASVQFVDEESKYLSSGEKAVFKPLSYTYRDVVYSDRDTLRIADRGYLFYCYECTSDGGDMKVMANIGQYRDKYTYWDGTNYETGKTVTCPELEDRVDFLLRTYASEEEGFFDKLDAVEMGLYSIALYPKSLKDTDRPYASGYPCLAASPYAELSLNEHIEGMYYTDTEGLFLDAVYGFVLDSASFPGMMGSVAKRLNPACEIARDGYLHWMVDITLDGVTRDYGGAGTGTTTSLYSMYVEKTFRFDGTDIGFGTDLSIPVLKEKRLEYAAKSDEFAQTALDKLSRESIAQTIGDAAWIITGRESMFGGASSVLCYAICGPGEGVSFASDAWVDGRYVSQWEMYTPGETFANHPTADIILHDVSYTDKYGKQHTGTVVYRYYGEEEDCWTGVFFFNRGTWYASDDLGRLPASLILTRAQVNEMLAAGLIDGNTNTPPKGQYIYDGSAEPGTPVA